MGECVLENRKVRWLQSLSNIYTPKNALKKCPPERKFLAACHRTVAHVLSHVWLCNSMDCRPQAPLSMEFSRQEYWSELPFSTPGDLPNPGIEPVSLLSTALEADSLPLSHLGSPQDFILCPILFNIFVIMGDESSLVNVKKIILRRLAI